MVGSKMKLKEDVGVPVVNVYVRKISEMTG
jgi:hypothetical protein